MPTEFDIGPQFMNMRLVWTVEAGRSASMEIRLRERHGHDLDPSASRSHQRPEALGWGDHEHQAQRPPGAIEYTASGLRTGLTRGSCATTLW
jgi:hypothetical protein